MKLVIYATLLFLTLIACRKNKEHDKIYSKTARLTFNHLKEIFPNIDDKIQNNNSLTPLINHPMISLALDSIITDHRYVNKVCRDVLASIETEGITEKPHDQPSLQQIIVNTKRDFDGWKRIKPGPYIYRERIHLTESNIILDGAGIAEIRGSDIWTQWESIEHEGKTYWMSQKSVAPRPGIRKDGKFIKDQLDIFECHKELQEPKESPGNMINTVANKSSSKSIGNQKADGLGMYKYSKCKWPEQVYINGKSLNQVSHDDMPNSGEFKVTQGGTLWNNRKIIIADDPKEAKVEVSVRKNWLVSDENIQNIIIKNFTMKHTNGYVTGGALTVKGSNWIIENNNFSHGESSNVGILCQNITFRNNNVFCGGNQGITGGKNLDSGEGNKDYSNKIISNNIFFNNTESGSGNWHSAGIKLVKAKQYAIEKNKIFANFGPGVWFDIDCEHNKISHNEIANNARGGLVIEISKEHLISKNIFKYNGYQTMLQNSAAIDIWSSSAIQIVKNRLFSNKVGIALRSKPRGKYQKFSNINVKENIVLQSGRSFPGNQYKRGLNIGLMAILMTQQAGGTFEKIEIEENLFGFLNGFNREKFVIADIHNLNDESFENINKTNILSIDQAQQIAKQFDIQF